MEENYRSTKNVLQAANEVIENNRNRRPKNSGHRMPKSLITYYRARDENDEAIFVASQIDQLRREGKAYRILQFSTGPMSIRTIEEALLKSNIPYTMVGGTKFYSRKEIRDVISYFEPHCQPIR